MQIPVRVGPRTFAVPCRRTAHLLLAQDRSANHPTSQPLHLRSNFQGGLQTDHQSCEHFLIRLRGVVSSRFSRSLRFVSDLDTPQNCACWTLLSI